MKRQEFIDWALSQGWYQDRYGHLQKEVVRNEDVRSLGISHYHYKLSRIAVRKEVRVEHTNGSHDWVRLRSGYLSKLSISSEGNLEGMTR